MPEDSLRLKLNQLKNKGFFEDLVVLRGIEKESLRVDGSGVISIKDHPDSLGSKYTNPEITIDFAESQIEMVSPIFDSAKNMIAYLEELHAFVLNNLEEDESLWPLSMPPRIKDASSIQIGKWPLTNNGKLKELYRVGLANRHGKIMQCVSGIHYNFSIDSKSLKILNPSPSNACRWRTGLRRWKPAQSGLDRVRLPCRAVDHLAAGLHRPRRPCHRFDHHGGRAHRRRRATQPLHHRQERRHPQL